MQVDVAERRQFDHPLRNNAAIADNDDHLRVERFQLAAKIGVVLDCVWLRDGKAQQGRGLFDRANGHFHATAFGFVGAGDDELYIEADFRQLLQCRNCKGGRAAEHEMEGRVHEIRSDSAESTTRQL